ncbi:MAG: hypothetical protein QGG40_15870 [Myxococcota bacterium]|nr:hypothetical protein [Myxococcota bacterium]
MQHDSQGSVQVAGSDSPDQAVRPRLSWTVESGVTRPLAGWEWVAWAVLVVWLWVSRWTVAPEVLFEWDSVNYALGIGNFDPFEHQPHPPGYPVFVMALRVLTWFGLETTRAFLVLNALFGTAVLGLLGWMARRSVGPLLALLLGVAFSVCPPFWSQGAVSTAYVAECFCSMACGAMALALVRGRISLPVVAGVAALIMGIRPSGVVTLLPVVLVAAVMVRPPRRTLAISTLVFGAVCSLWFFPLIIASGGWDAYQTASDALAEWQLDMGSILSGQWKGVSRNIEDLFYYLFDCMNLLWLPLLVNLLVVVGRRRFSSRTCVLMAVWLLPGALTYALHHLAKSAYVLTLAPGVFLAVVLTLAAAISGAGRATRWLLGLLNGVIGIGYLLLNVAAFYSAVPVALFEERDADIEWPSWAFVTGDYGQVGLQYRTWPQEKIRGIVEEMDREHDLALFLFGAHEMHRIERFYHPDQWMAATSVDHGEALIAPPTPQFPQSFGEYQLVVLRATGVGNTMKEPTLISATSDEITLTRNGQELDIQLDRELRRVVVFYPCPPCDMDAGEGLRVSRVLDVGAGFGAMEIVRTSTEGSSGEDRTTP